MEKNKVFDNKPRINVFRPKNEKAWKLITLMAFDMRHISDYNRIKDMTLDQKEELDAKIANSLILFRHITKHLDLDKFNKDPKTEELLVFIMEQLNKKQEEQL